MSHPMIKTACMAAGFAIVTLAANSAQAAQPTSVKHHMNAAQKGLLLAPPKTMSEAASTEIRLPDGKAVAVQVPTELWNHVSVQTDSSGKQHLVESSSDVAPTQTREGSNNE